MEPRDEEYLWDRTGPVDEDVARLEALLAPLAAPSAGQLRPLPLVADAPDTSLSWRTVLAAAALVFIALGTAWLTSRPARPDDPWRVAHIEGRPTMAAAPLASRSRLEPGRWVETDASSTAVMFIGRIGRLELAPQSRLRVVTAAPGDHRAELVRGTIEAQIWAPPGQFVIDTPSATAVDLGCAYTLTMDEHGGGLITVQGGWVGFEHGGREAFIPAGASGRTRPGRGPGTPTYTDAPATLREAVDVIDQADTAAAQSDALAIVLRDARREDGFTLWHLIDRVDRSLVPQVVDGLAALVPMPDEVTREGILGGNREMRDAWWSALGLGTADWWRTWRQRWNPVK